MPNPDRQAARATILRLLEDGDVRREDDVIDAGIARFVPTDSSLVESPPEGGWIYGRLSSALAVLKRAGHVETQGPGLCRITDRGRDVLVSLRGETGVLEGHPTTSESARYLTGTVRRMSGHRSTVISEGPGDKLPPGSHRGPVTGTTVLGGYELNRVLGTGGSAVVWDALDREMGRRVALKVLDAGNVESPDAFKRFQREGRLAASLNHPRCVYTFFAGEFEGHPVIAMELMCGGTLHDVMKDGPVDYRRAVELTLDIIEGLEAASNRGILHRDVKPSNCFLDEYGRAKIGDFGISKSLETPSSLTTTDSFLGTVYYASPEQVMGEDVDFRSDMYSVGVVLFELLAGKPPFMGVHAPAVLAKVMTEDPPTLPSSSPVPAGLQKVMRRLLAKSKDKRYTSYESLRYALLPYAAGRNLPAGQLQRFGAILIDLPVLMVPMLAIPMVGASWIGLAFRFSLLFIIPFLYFNFTESRWGRSIGKYVLGLVVSTVGTEHPSVRQIVVRSSVFVGCVQLYFLPIVFVEIEAFDASAIWFLQAVQFVLIAVMLSTMRRRNGFAGLHEIVSRTRVLHAGVASRTTETSKRAAVLGSMAESESGSYGPFRKTGVVWRNEYEALIVARDRVLNRDVWIHEYETGTVVPTRTAVERYRHGCLPLLQRGDHGSRTWDAYGAVTGRTLEEWIRQRGCRSWGDMRRVILAVAKELQYRFEEVGTAGHLSMHNIIVDHSGQARLLNFPTTNPESVLDVPCEVTPRNWRSFIHQLVIFGLEGQLLTPQQLERRTARVPLPQSVRPVVMRLCGEGESFTTTSAFVSVLEPLTYFPAKVQRTRRAVGIMVVALLLPFPTLLQTAIGPAVLYGETIGTGQVPSASASLPFVSRGQLRRFREAALPVDVVSVVSAFTSARLRRWWFSELYVGLRITGAWLGLFGMAAPILAFIFRGSPMLFLVGIAVQRRNGSPATRGRCLMRSLVGWSPLIGLSITSMQGWSPTWEWQPLVPIVITVLAAGYSMYDPERGVPDRLVGTVLVPK